MFNFVNYRPLVPNITLDSCMALFLLPKLLG